MIIALTILLAIAVAAGLVWECYHAGVTRMYTLWPAALYLALTAACPAAYTAWQGQLAVVALMMLTIRLDRTYLEAHAQEVCFTSTLALLVASLLHPALYAYIPVMLIALIYQQAFTLRALLAILIAIGTFAVWYAIYLYLLGYGELIHWPHLMLPTMPIWQLAILSVILIAAIYMLFCIFWRFGRISRRRRFMTSLHTMYFVVAVVYSLFTADGAICLPLLIYPTCILAVLYKRRND